MRLVGRPHCYLQLSSRCVALSCLPPRGYPASNVAWTPTVPLLPRCSLPNIMSTSTADTAASRREKAAHAAERRLQGTTMAIKPATASPSSTACKTRHVSAGSRPGGGGEGGGSRKRPAEQVGFSDSDGDEVTCVGVSVAAHSTQGRGSKGTAPAGRGGGAASNKRGRTDEVSSDQESRTELVCTTAVFTYLLLMYTNRSLI